MVQIYKFILVKKVELDLVARQGCKGGHGLISGMTWASEIHLAQPKENKSIQ